MASKTGFDRNAFYGRLFFAGTGGEAVDGP
jgi:hypothetical protein